MWNNYFDKTYLINLPDRVDRLKESKQELSKHNIPFEIYPAIKHQYGQLGIHVTLYELLHKAFYDGLQNVFIFEDDVKFVNDPNEWLDKSAFPFKSLQYDIFYFGCNTHQPLEESSWNNVLKVKNAYALHSVCFSRNGMSKMLYFLKQGYKNPVDVMIADKIQTQGFSFCTYPLLATQRESFSDIENRDVNYSFIEQRFEQNTKHLKL
jgi:GR25 family glycosyltransferase involved in LPS biosynthesis